MRGQPLEWSFSRTLRWKTFPNLPKDESRRRSKQGKPKFRTGALGSPYGFPGRLCGTAIFGRSGGGGTRRSTNLVVEPQRGVDKRPKRGVMPSQRRTSPRGLAEGPAAPSRLGRLSNGQRADHTPHPGRTLRRERDDGNHHRPRWWHEHGVGPNRGCDHTPWLGAPSPLAAGVAASGFPPVPR